MTTAPLAQPDGVILPIAADAVLDLRPAGSQAPNSTIHDSPLLR
jgi:hypothetical protein